MPEGELRAVIVCGLHADARRETVEGLLRRVPHSVALYHDLSAAEQGAVRRTVRDATGELASGEAPLVNDCACCALREDLLPALGPIASDTTITTVVVELWDSVEPRASAEVITRHGQGPGGKGPEGGRPVRLSGVITAVDPGLVLPCLVNGDDLADAGLATAPGDRRTIGDTWARQLEYASVLALAGNDAASDQERALITQLHPTAQRVSAGSAELVRRALAGFDTEAAAAAQHPACALLPQEAQEAGVGTLVWRGHRPFHPGRLHDALEELACAAVRSRGRFWLADRPDTLLSWDAAGGALCVENNGPWLASLPDAAWAMVPPLRRAAAALDWHPEHGDRCQHLVFVSPGLDRTALTLLLDSCLLTEAEYAAGRDGWKNLPAVFDTFLGQAS